MTSDLSLQEEDGQVPLEFQPHDHAECATRTLREAEEQCEKQGLRLTAVRRKVLEILLQEHRAMGAYAILDILNKEGLGSQPPVAYRALDFLSQHGFVHKIERLNSFVACTHPEQDHSPVFLICRVCETVAEARTGRIESIVQDAAFSAGFRAEKAVIEIEGICPICQEANAA